MRSSTSRIVFALSAVVLLAAACSSGFSRDDAIATLTEDGSMNEADAACVVDGIEELDSTSLGQLENNAELSAEQREALLEVISECVQLGAQQTAASSEGSTTTTSSVDRDLNESSEPPGTDAELDALWIDCREGDNAACSDLFWGAPEDSAYEAFGFLCGGREGECADSESDTGFGDVDFSDLSPSDPPPGDDADLDALWVECADGSATACDQLFFAAPVDSDYERFGYSCGARENTSCTDLLGDDSGSAESDGPALTDFSDLSPSDPPPGDDAELDALWVACSDRSADACDDLFFSAPTGSVYERFGFSCGARAIGICETVLS